MTAIDIVIMAAGKGTRMKSRVPKVLHRLAGRPLLQHVLDCAARLEARRVVVITGNGAGQVETAVAGMRMAPPPVFARQEPQLGTGHAVQQALPFLPDDGVTLILNGDVPLIEAATLRSLVETGGDALVLLTVDLPDPAGYGRIVRSGAAVQGIVEHKDASEDQRRIAEVYTGVMAVPNRRLKQWLPRLENTSARTDLLIGYG